MSDLLDQATRALRETSAEPQHRSGLTRARLLASAEKRYASRRSAPLRWVVMIAAALAASTALARVAQYWPEIKRAIAPESAQHGADAKPNAKRVRPAAKPVPPQLPAAEPVAPPAESIENPAAADSPPAANEPLVAPKLQAAGVPPRIAVRKPRVRVAAPAPAPAPETTSSARETTPPVPAESADLMSFRRAQRLHLAHDPRALAAWDDYLRVSGAGALAPEARYNRALCLIRIGRKAEAKSALAAFAAGEYGSYRRSEAQALIAALDAKP